MATMLEMATFEMSVFTKGYDRIASKSYERGSGYTLENLVTEAGMLVEWARVLSEKFPMAAQLPARVSIKVEDDPLGLFPDGIKEFNLYFATK